MVNTGQRSSRAIVSALCLAGGCFPDLDRDAGSLTLTVTDAPAEADQILVEVTSGEVTFTQSIASDSGQPLVFGVETLPSGATDVAAEAREADMVIQRLEVVVIVPENQRLERTLSFEDEANQPQPDPDPDPDPDPNPNPTTSLQTLNLDEAAARVVDRANELELTWMVGTSGTQVLQAANTELSTESQVLNVEGAVATISSAGPESVELTDVWEPGTVRLEFRDQGRTDELGRSPLVEDASQVSFSASSTNLGVLLPALNAGSLQVALVGTGVPVEERDLEGTVRVQLQLRFAP